MLRLGFVLGLTVVLGACGGSSTSGAGGAANGGAAGSSTGGTAGASTGGTAGSSTGGTAGSSTGGGAGSSTGGTAGSSTGGAGPTCGSPPCGGDLTGTWTIQKACASGSESITIPNCSSSATLTVTNISDSGTATFAASGTQQGNSTVSFSEHLVVPQGCSTAAKCAQYQTALSAQSGVTNATCNFQGTCTCDLTQTTSSTASGTYQTSGTSVTVIDGSGNQTVASYCVANNTLTMTGTNSGLTLTLVLTRQ